MSRVWTASKDGLLKYTSLSSYHVKDVFHLMRKSFFKEEQVSVAVGLNRNPQAINELDELITDLVEDGTSVVAVEEKTGKVVATILNKVIQKKQAPNGYFSEFNFKHPAAKTFDEINIAIDKALNGFELFKSDCYFESVFVSVLPEYRRKSVPVDLLLSTLQIAQNLKDGIDVRVPVNNNVLAQISKPPAGILGIATTMSTKVVMERENFCVAKVVNFGNTFTETPLTPIYIMFHPLK